MAREFARKFYSSTEWQKCREFVFKRDFGLCVKCGEPGQEVHHKTWLTPGNIHDTNITLNANNLITLCKECHHAEHTKYKSKSIRGMKFDEQGNLVSDMPPIAR